MTEESTSYEFVPHRNQAESNEETLQDADDLEEAQPKKTRGKCRNFAYKILRFVVLPTMK